MVKVPSIAEAKENYKNYEYKNAPILRKKFSSMSFFHALGRTDKKESIERLKEILSSGTLKSLKALKELNNDYEAALEGTLDKDIKIGRDNYIYFLLGRAYKHNSNFSIVFELPHEKLRELKYDEVFFCNDYCLYTEDKYEDYRKTILILEDGVNALADCVGNEFEADYKEYINTRKIRGFFNNKFFKHEFAVKESLLICDEAVIVHLVGLDAEKEGLEALIAAENYKQTFEWHSGPTEFENYLIKKSSL
ncbi:hypothetical protein [Bacillus wiedmannii]|uniref:hypothetical protein n=1 Tax=Bacillus wiedmannii TaxID=1890302 RepID=UPI000BF47EC7|nr:hypothetical protein [Bacillus wiedmannii]PEP22065.1 hypothetical protein CN580_19875 [Bacillus wiedmannii]